MKVRQHLEARQELDLARTALAAGQIDDALHRLGRALRADPGLIEARLIEAKAHLARNDATQALTALDCHDLYVLERRNQPEVAMLRAQALVRSGQHNLAQPLLEKLTAEFPDDTRPHEMLAAMSLRLGLTAQAITHHRELVRLRPQSREDRQALAKLLENDDPQAAIDLLIQTPRQHIDAPLRLWLADLYHRTGRARDAEDTFATLLASEIHDAPLWRQAGILADQAGADSLALRRLTRAAGIESKRRPKGKTTPQPNPLSLEALALVHLHAGRFAQAGRCYWRITRHATTVETPSSKSEIRNQKSEIPQAWAGLAVSALASNHLSLAQRASQQLAEHAPSDQARQLLAGLWQHAAVGRAILYACQAAAAAAIDTNSTVSPDSEMGIASTAPATQQPPATPPACSLHDLLNRAVATLQAQALIHPNRADTQYHLAQCHVALGNANEASQAAHAALAINPNYAAAANLDARLR